MLQVQVQFHLILLRAGVQPLIEAEALIDRAQTLKAMTSASRRRSNTTDLEANTYSSSQDSTED